MSFATADDDDFTAVSRQALRTGDPASALRSLGWWDLLSQLDDPQLRPAIFAVFRAQGRELAGSTALSGLLAQPYLAMADCDAGEVLAAAPHYSPRRGIVPIVVGEVAGQRIVVDQPGLGASILNADEVTLRRVQLPGRLPISVVDVNTSRWKPTVSEPEAMALRAESHRLGRVASAIEILGATEAAVDLAVDYARQREQFGKPIGTFQAVRHLLAWARTDCIAIESVASDAVRLGPAAPLELDRIVKALAGRNGRRACERALQVFGGIGFTAEHEHHHFHSRVLALNSLLGTSAELTHDLGVEFRSAGGSNLPTSMLLH
jgi:Acyl-CoA dehydrogenase, C-terminal domain